jgi:peptidyl-prolyl cis-trans isomerase B (cyclophilin B)
VAVVLAVAACGSSSPGAKSVSGSEYTATSTGSSRAETSTQTSGISSAAGNSGGGQQPTASSVQVPGCRSVPAPASRAGEQASRPTAQLDPTRSYTVRLATNCGAIVIQLAVKEAPKTTSSFAHLVKLGYYNGLTFHRVVAGFVIQGGDPNGDGTGGPSWEIVEPPPANLRYSKGVVAMAKGGTAPSGASASQFFIVTGSSVNLPPAYALVGHVVSGEQAVDAISHVPTEAGPEGGEASKPRAPMVIERATLSVR